MGNQQHMKGLGQLCREGDEEALLHYERTDRACMGSLIGTTAQLGAALPIAIIGAIRSGKTLCLQMLLRLLAVGPVCFRGEFATRNRAVVFDKHLQFESFARSCGVPEDYLFQTYPFAANAHGTDLQAELRTDHDRRVFALLLTGGQAEATGNEKFWRDLAAVLVYAVTATYAETRGSWTLADIIRPFATGAIGQLEHILKHSAAGRTALDILKASGMDRVRSNARVSLYAELALQSEIAAATEHHIRAGRTWSFRRDLLNGSPLVFMGNPTESKPLSTLVAAQQSFFAQTILEDSDRDTAAPGFTDPTFFYLDELVGTKVPHLTTLLREGPKRGFCGAAVIHDFHGLSQTYGETEAKHLVSQLAQGIILCKSNDPETRTLASDLLGGKGEEWRRSFSTDPDGNVSTTDAIVDRWFIDPATFLNWPLASFDRGFPCIVRTPSGLASMNWVEPEQLRELIPPRPEGTLYERLAPEHQKLREFEPADWDRLRLPKFADSTSTKHGFVDPDELG